MSREDSNKFCAFCNVELKGASRSKEHVIPNSIGGWLKTSDFICIECNSTRGDSWDSELAEQVNWFSLSLGITRERGLPPGQLVKTVDGRQYTLLPDGSFSPKSSYSEEFVDGKKRINMVAKSIAEAKKRLNGVARKHPTFDLEKALSELKIDTAYMDSPLTVELSLGGGKAGRSLVKTALAFASHCGIPHSQFGRAIAYLLDMNAEPPYGHAYLSDLVINRNKETIFHCVSLKSDPNKSRLWSYIEYFGLFRVIILINDNYTGPKVDEIYALDPITGEEIHVAVNSNITDEEFFKVIDGYGVDHAIHKAAADFALPIIIKRSDQRALDSAVRAGFVYAAETLGIPEGSDIPLEKAEQFTTLMMEKISPYISHRIRSNR